MRYGQISAKLFSLRVKQELPKLGVKNGAAADGMTSWAFSTLCQVKGAGLLGIVPGSPECLGTL